MLLTRIGGQRERLSGGRRPARMSASLGSFARNSVSMKLRAQSSIVFTNCNRYIPMALYASSWSIFSSMPVSRAVCGACEPSTLVETTRSRDARTARLSMHPPSATKSADPSLNAAFTPAHPPSDTNALCGSKLMWFPGTNAAKAFTHVEIACRCNARTADGRVACKRNCCSILFEVYSSQHVSKATRRHDRWASTGLSVLSDPSSSV
mmetsp:Transcript_10150/g.32006  ORF Transcript_10150/g.32006 Transcript_10150/m.32006 type:complete len:208 (-) Transcript_10150:180-803(-)